MKDINVIKGKDSCRQCNGYGYLKFIEPENKEAKGTIKPCKCLIKKAHKLEDKKDWQFHYGDYDGTKKMVIKKVEKPVVESSEFAHISG